MRQLRFHPQASREFLDAIQYYDSEAPGVGDRFQQEVERSSAEIREFPDAFERAEGDVRRKPLRRFPYSLFYAIEPDRIRILAVAHQRRKPGYWRSRLP